MNFNRIFFICTMMVGMQMVAMEEATVVVAEPGQHPLTAMTQVKSPFSTATEEQLKAAMDPDFSDEATPVTTESVSFAQAYTVKPVSEWEQDFQIFFNSHKNNKEMLFTGLNKYKYHEHNKKINERISELEQLEKEKKEQEQTSTPVIHRPAVSEPLSASAAAQMTPSKVMNFPVSAAIRDRSKSFDVQSTIKRDAKKLRAVSFDASETPKNQVPLLVRQAAQLKLDTNPEIQKPTPQPNTSGSTASASLITPTKPYNWKAWLGIGAGVAAAVAATVIWYFWSYQKPIASH